MNTVDKKMFVYSYSSRTKEFTVGEKKIKINNMDDLNAAAKELFAYLPSMFGKDTRDNNNAAINITGMEEIDKQIKGCKESLKDFVANNAEMGRAVYEIAAGMLASVGRGVLIGALQMAYLPNVSNTN